MRDDLAPGVVTHAVSMAVVHSPLPEDQAVSGRPTAALTSLGSISGVEIGVWEMSEGVATDTEVDEILIVLAGRARVEFLEPPAPSIDLAVGDVLRLTAGMHTRWTVSEMLRTIHVG